MCRSFDCVLGWKRWEFNMKERHVGYGNERGGPTKGGAGVDI